MQRRVLQKGIQVLWQTCLISGLVAGSVISAPSSKGFCAYYSKIHSGLEFEKYSRTGPYADIVVQLRPGERLVFWRGSSYLPYWETSKGRWFVDEFVPRKGDGTKEMPDRVNAFSHVELVENTAHKIRVHWRYLPEFGVNNYPSTRTGVSAVKFVDEYFVITPDGKVTRTCKRGTEKIDDWKDPLNQITQTFVLSTDGVQGKKLFPPKSSTAAAAVAGSPVKTGTVVEPAAWWKFDEGKGDAALESLKNITCPIEGHKSLWKKGVSGTALQFDGYNTLISLPAGKSPAIPKGLTLEAWIAIGAYPWNWAPIVQQGDDEGYCLGVDAHGYPGFKARIGGTWREVVSQTHLERFTWYHLAGVYDPSTGSMSLYVNGAPSVVVYIPETGIQTALKDIRIGKAAVKRRPTDPVRKSTFPAEYGIDALLDEVRIYDAGLSAQQVRQSYDRFNPGPSVTGNPDMDRRGLPQEPSRNVFQAYYTKLKYFETWDNLWRVGETPDVVVEFDGNPTKFVFWRGVSYIPHMVNDKNQWYNNEFNETWNKSGGEGCMEPMSDKENYTAHARIVEQSQARVVVQYRVALMDVKHVYANYDSATGWSDWMDWYWTVYPDGVAAKRMQLWTNGQLNHEWHESIIVLGENQHPEQIIEKQPCFTLVTADGRVKDFDWITAPPSRKSVDYTNTIIHVANLKSDWDPFTVQRFTGGDVYDSELTPYAVFCTWNHWPTAQIPSDGRYASFPDRAGHSSLTHVKWDYFKKEEGNAPYVMKTLLEGMSNVKPLELMPLAKSWLDAPAVENAAGCASEGFDQSQRAYVLETRNASLSFNIAASEKSPMVNPCFMVHHWDCSAKASLRVNGKVQNAGPDFRQGVILDPDGRECMVIWLKTVSTTPVRFTVQGAKPVF